MHQGNWFGLPDLGITEAVGSLFGKSRTAQDGSNLWGPNNTGAQTPPPTTPPPSGGGGSSAGTGTGGGQVKPAATKQNPTTSFNLPQEIQTTLNNEQGQNEDLQARQKADISASFDPIFAELDRQIGMAPEQRVALESQVANLATQQQADVEAAKQKGVQQVQGAQAQEANRAKDSLRGLEEDIRSQLQARSNYFGAVGAGDSSATGRASEAIAKAGLKARGGILSTRNDVLGQLEGKKTDVMNLASEQTRKVDEWKSNKMFEVGQWFTDQVNKLNSEKANASGERQKAINQVIFGLQNQFMQRAQQLDDAVLNYKTSISTWEQQRAAELEDFATKLGIQAQYTAGQDNQTKYNFIQDAFGNTVAVNPYNPSEAPVQVTGQLDSFGAPKQKKGLLEGLGDLFSGGQAAQ